MPCSHLGPIRSQSRITSVQLLCTRSMENCPDSFVIVPAILHDPSQFASVPLSAAIVQSARARICADSNVRSLDEPMRVDGSGHAQTDSRGSLATTGLHSKWDKFRSNAMTDSTPQSTFRGLPLTPEQDAEV